MLACSVYVHIGLDLNSTYRHWYGGPRCQLCGGMNYAWLIAQRTNSRGYATINRICDSMWKLDHNTRGNLVPLALVDEMRLADLATKVFSYILRYGTRRDGAQD